MTESPRRNIFEMYLSLFTGLDFFLPLPVFGTSVHISFTFSITMLQCLTKHHACKSSDLNMLWLLHFVQRAVSELQHALISLYNSHFYGTVNS